MDLVQHCEVGTLSVNLLKRYLLRMHDEYRSGHKMGFDVDKYSLKLSSLAEGFVVFSAAGEIQAGIWGYMNDVLTKKAYISYIGKLKESGGGLAARLHGEFVEHARKAGMVEIELQVRKENSHAIGFYQRLGYHMVDERDSYWVYNLALL